MYDLLPASFYCEPSRNLCYLGHIKNTDDNDNNNNNDDDDDAASTSRNIKAT